MKFEADNIYHVYNRGNNKQQIFFTNENYLFFLRKLKKQLLPNAELLCYCLLPNHFHLMVLPKSEGLKEIQIGSLTFSHLSKAMKDILSQYSRAINIQEKRTGSLFTQNTKSKNLSGNMPNENYSKTCFSYIHQNPLKAGLVKDLKDWPFSSFLDYACLRTETPCNIELGKKLFGLDMESMIDNNLGDADVEKIF